MNPATVPDDSARQRQELARWFLRRQDAPGPVPWTAQDEQAFQHWLANPANAQAYARWQADWTLIDAMPRASVERLRAMAVADQAAEQRTRQPAGRPRRWALAQGLALAGVAGVTLAGGWLGWQQLQARPVFEQAFHTRRGQQTEATLPDGSSLRLDTATALQTVFFRGRREVRLAQGQAFFAVARDAARPFTVRAGDALVTVLGTRFSVRYTPGVPGRDGVEVAVEEGRVRVARGPGTGAAPAGGTAEPETFELTAGQAVVLPADGSRPLRGAVPAVGVAAWRTLPLSFSDVPLQEAVAEMERYADLGIAALDPAAASLRLTGTFDPRSAATTRRLLADALPIRLVDGPRGLEVLPRR